MDNQGTKHHVYSPSSLEATELCPGRVKLSAGLESPRSDEASEGTLLHNAVATRSLEGLTAEQAELVTDCMEQLARFTGGAWQMEQRLTLTDENFEVLTRGTADAVLVRDKDCVLIDWKFGRNPVTCAQTNIQLLAYAAALLQSCGRERCQFMVYQPRLRRLTEGMLERSDIDCVIMRIQRIVARAENGIELHAGEQQCKYCAAVGRCPEHRLTCTALEVRHCSEIDDPQEIANLLDAYHEAFDLIKRGKESADWQAKQLLLRGEEVPGWQLRARSGQRQITDTQAAYQVLHSAGLPHEGIMAAVTMSATKLEDAFARLSKEKDGTTLKAAREQFAALMAECIVRKPDSETLVRAKVKE